MELHREGSAPAPCAAGLFVSKVTLNIFFLTNLNSSQTELEYVPVAHNVLAKKLPYLFALIVLAPLIVSFALFRLKHSGASLIRTLEQVWPRAV